MSILYIIHIICLTFFFFFSVWPTTTTTTTQASPIKLGTSRMEHYLALYSNVYCVAFYFCRPCHSTSLICSGVKDTRRQQCSTFHSSYSETHINLSPLFLAILFPFIISFFFSFCFGQVHRLA